MKVRGQVVGNCCLHYVVPGDQTPDCQTRQQPPSNLAIPLDQEWKLLKLLIIFGWYCIIEKVLGWFWDLIICLSQSVSQTLSLKYLEIPNDLAI